MRFCLSDIKENEINNEINNLPILPILSGNNSNNIIGTLRIFSPSQISNIRELSNMGFSFSDSLGSLSQCQFRTEQALEKLIGMDYKETVSVVL